MQDGDIKLYNAPGAPSYLVQRIDSDNYLIHREVTKEECEKLDTGQVIEHGGKHFRSGILNVPDLAKAESVIQGYFQAHCKLKKCFA